jgi:heptaprenyl diphosphate synthase
MKESVQESSNGSPRESPRLLGGNIFRSSDLFLTGLLMMAAFLCNASTILRTAQFLLFWFYAWLMGKKNKPLITLLVILGIVFFNLLVPYGRVFLEFGVFRITQGSLLGGLHKAVTLEGLIMLSKASIRPDLRLPGPFGAILGESLRIFDGISDQKSLITRKHLIEGIDAYMLKLSAEQELLESLSPVDGSEPQRTLRSILLLGAAVLPILVLTVIGFIRAIA